MTLHLLSELATIPNGDISLTKYAWDNEWTCLIQAEHDGTKLQIKGKASTPSAAIEDAHERYLALTDRGAPQMRPNLLVNQPSAPTKPANDNIPF